MDNNHIEGYDSLAELALDMRWCWDHGTDAVWSTLEPTLWELTHNPWAVLQTASRDRLAQIMADPAFRAEVDAFLLAKRQAADSPAWFQQHHPDSPLRCAAYFSMEFMLSEALPIYAGGLGNVAGDQLKTASDLGVPVVGVGLLYQQGYFRQEIDAEGAQQALFPYNDPGQLPITPLREQNGEWLRLEIALPGYSVWLRAWQVQVGRVRLYLLDSNDPANHPLHRGITSELYGEGPELRLRQELLLGIGGWRLLTALGLQPEVCHLNEGHAAFAVLERARDRMRATGQPFHEALRVTRAGNLFTTHTAVEAGFDRFEPWLIEQYLGAYATEGLGIPAHELLSLGRANPADASEKFNMAYLAIRGSGAVNAVSRLHGDVSRRLFQPLYPHWPQAEVPVRYVTNGVHMPTWDSMEADDLWTAACGKGRWLGTMETLEQDIRKTSDDRLWQLRRDASAAFVGFARERLSRTLAASGHSPEAVDRAKHILDPNILTIGFARRFATYKRPNLLLRDEQRLLRLLTNPERPVQLVLAGKAHPADGGGQALIQQWIRFIRRPEVLPHAIFLPDYDMHLTEHLAQGVDVWLNTPRRPWEACGTSGMKVLVNGGLNLSELDGWWAEAYAPDLGWALGDGAEHGEDPAWDDAEANRLYELLEREVIPEYYHRDERGIPVAWVARIRESMARLTPRFSSNRSVREYTERHYIPAAAEFRARAAGAGLRNPRELDAIWSSMRFGDVSVKTGGGRHFFSIPIWMSGAGANARLLVELYADGLPGGDPERHEMRAGETNPHGATNYTATFPATRPAAHYTARVIPREGAPLEDARILWQK